MDYLYGIDEAVTVRSDLHVNVRYHMKSGPMIGLSNDITDEMKKFAGKTVHISDYIRGQYWLKEDIERWNWTDEMFEDVPNDECVCESLL